MKKVFLALTIFTVIASSCGSSSTDGTVTNDSTSVKQDSMTCDTTCVADSAKK
jgi:hypothetical protein